MNTSNNTTNRTPAISRAASLFSPKRAITLPVNSEYTPSIEELNAMDASSLKVSCYFNLTALQLVVEHPDLLAKLSPEDIKQLALTSCAHCDLLLTTDSVTSNRDLLRALQETQYFLHTHPRSR